MNDVQVGPVKRLHLGQKPNIRTDIDSENSIRRG